MCGQGSRDVGDGPGADVAQRLELSRRELHELADGLDLGTLQRVVDALLQVEGFDRPLEVTLSLLLFGCGRALLHGNPLADLSDPLRGDAVMGRNGL